MLRDDQTPVLAGLPPQWRYCLTGGNDDAKVCFEEGWNKPGNGRTLDDVLRINTSPDAFERWKSKKCIGVGAITGPESGGLLVIDFDGTGSEAVRAFREHFHHNPSDLPNTLCNESGKKGRGKVFLYVPPHWWPQLDNRSATWRKGDRVVLEAIWMNGTGTGRHAVLCGDHPQSSHQNPLYYRWINGHSPSDVEWAEAPEWLLLGIIAQFDMQVPETREERKRAGDEDATPWERLKTAERLLIVEEALPFCPTRDGKGSGTYEKVRRILCGLIDEFGQDLATAIVLRSKWNDRNDWGDRETAETVIASLAKSAGTVENRATIGSLLHFARNNGFQWPNWALPPLEQAELHIDGLKKLLNKMNQCDHDQAALAAWVGRARREFGVDADDLYRLRLEQYLGVIERKGSRTLDDITSRQRNDNVQLDVIDGLVSRRVHVLAGGSHSGKTTLACFLANRVLNGTSVDVGRTRYSTTGKGRVLILTSDCSDEDMVRDLALEGLDRELCGDRLRIDSGSTFQDMISIVKTLETFKPDLVICDCLTSMAVPGVKVGDPSYADPIRLLVRHNGISWPKCAFLVLHHTSRDEPLRFSGTEQIKAACEELWVYYNPELLKQKRTQVATTPTRHLLFEKSRGGRHGRKLTITRDGYTGEWQWLDLTEGSGSPLDVLTEAFRSVTHDQWQIPADWMRELDLKFHPKSFRRYLEQLVGTVLETEMRIYEPQQRQFLHYRPRNQIRRAAQEMVGSRGDGINAV